MTSIAHTNQNEPVHCPVKNGCSHCLWLGSRRGGRRYERVCVSVFQVLILYFQPSVFRCILLRWVRLLGFSTVYGTLTLKLYR